MALYEKKWWKKIFKKKIKSKKGETSKEIQIILEFLQDINGDIDNLTSDLKKLNELSKELEVADQGIVQINLETQIKLLDDILKRYEFFQNDVDINGIRVKRIAHETLNKAKQEGLRDLVKEKEKSWIFWW